MALDRHPCGPRPLAPAALLALAAAALAVAPRARPEPRIATISQGTNIAVAAFPDGESLVIDLLGSLWRLPASGGGATRLTPEDEAARHPRVGPNGRRVVYQRLVGGQWDVWLMDVAAGTRRALADSAHHEREPDFAPDGRSIVFASDRAGDYDLWRIDIETGELAQLTDAPGDAAFPAASERGDIAYVSREAGGSSLQVLLPSGENVELHTSRNRLSAPSWRQGGGVLVFNEQQTTGPEAPRSALKMLVLSADPVVKTLTHGEDVFESRPAWASPGEYIYAADGRIWRRGIAHVTRELVPMFAAVTVDSGTPASIKRPLDARGPSPALGVAGRDRSADGRVEVLAALGDLWIAGRRGEPRRLTDDEFVEIDPSVAPDGSFAVFAGDRGGYMDLWRVTLPGGVPTQLSRSPAKAYRPSISPDGARVAFLETDGFDTHGESRLRILALPDGEPRTVADALIDAGPPRWQSPQEVLVTLRAGTAQARRIRVDASSGRVAAAEAATQPARSGIETFEAALTPPPLEWQPAEPSEPYVIQVGRLFDGVRSDYRRHMDVHVEGQRIKAIVARGLLPLPERVIDLRDGTLIPGLIDAHAHQSSILGERLGRTWLAHGVTTIREVSDEVPAALERAEAWASARRLGPRVVVSPAAGPGETGAPAELPTPVPVQAYSGLRPSAALFLPSGSTPYDWLDSELARLRTPFAARTSPLRLTYDDVLRTLVESRTFVTSSIAAAAGLPMRARALKRLLEHPTFRRMYTADERARWLDGSGASGRAESLQQNLARLIRAGGRIAAGTDAPATPYGLGVHVELALLAEAGIPADQVLRIATASNALALGLERQLGTLQEGKLADFVVVDGDPLSDVADALNVVAVVRGGLWLDQERLSGR